ncbi:lysozyme [Hyphomicrobium sp.]|uniref:lysozyme n=1 Tax=Hyphomicrobium sp. TaxID=82 RepID=UPI0025C5C6B5|nr:lysozyme [Hyphomicrobium sp.]MCC7251460.1 lysozyme [Hyphomicrobium sp.]
MHSFYLDAIRNFEGFTPQASWDYAQFSTGYGTKARFAGEVIDRAEAERRFQTEVSAARSLVEKAAPHVDDGTKAALTSLTYNAGTAWIESGLGDAVRRGDLEAAREIFQKYNKAGGEVLPGLVNRRSQEALWIGNPDAVAMGGAVGAGLTDGDATAALPPVIVDRDQSARTVAEMIAARPVRSVATAAEGRADVFERGPRTERLALSGPLASVANEALMALVGGERLGPGGAAEIARLAQLGRGSELASRDQQDKETRRV